MASNAGRPVRVPGPDHPIIIERQAKRIVVTVSGRTIADTRAALTLREASYKPVHYVPRADVDMSLLDRTAHGTYCPYKGDASYFSIHVGEDRRESAIWSYETPYSAVAEIKDHLAFYSDRVDAIDERDA